MKYKLLKEHGDYLSLLDNSYVTLLEANEVYTSGGWEADGWVELPDLDAALQHFLVRPITEKEKEFYRLYAEVYAETLEENARILDKRRELITK